MKVTLKDATVRYVSDLQAGHSLDPIVVVTINDAPGAGRIIIQCYNRAWTAYWGSMSGRSVEEFFVSCDPGYLLGNLTWNIPRLKRDEKRDDAYLGRIVRAVQAALKGGNDAHP